MAKRTGHGAKRKSNSLPRYALCTLRPALSFTPQTLYRVGQRRTDTLPADRQQRYQKRCPASQDKDAGAEFDTIGKILQPLVHRVPGNRDG